MIEWLVSGSRQEMGKSTFGLALSAQLIDLPLFPKVQWHLFFSASLIIPDIACNIFATFYFECLSRYLNPIHMFGAKMVVWEKESKSLFEPSPIQ